MPLMHLAGVLWRRRLLILAGLTDCRVSTLTTATATTAASTALTASSRLAPSCESCNLGSWRGWCGGSAADVRAANRGHCSDVGSS